MGKNIAAAQMQADIRGGGGGSSTKKSTKYAFLDQFCTYDIIFLPFSWPRRIVGGGGKCHDRAMRTVQIRIVHVDLRAPGFSLCAQKLENRGGGGTIARAR